MDPSRKIWRALQSMGAFLEEEEAAEEVRQAGGQTRATTRARALQNAEPPQEKARPVTAGPALPAPSTALPVPAGPAQLMGPAQTEQPQLTGPPPLLALGHSGMLPPRPKTGRAGHSWEAMQAVPKTPPMRGGRSRSPQQREAGQERVRICVATVALLNRIYADWGEQLVRRLAAFIGLAGKTPLMDYIDNTTVLECEPGRFAVRFSLHTDLTSRHRSRNADAWFSCVVNCTTVLLTFV
jgi:hypothetical protein